MKYIICYTLCGNSLSLFFSTVVNELIKRGNEVVVITDHSITKKRFIRDDCTLYTWPSKRPTQLKDAIFFYNVCKRHIPDVVIANFGAENIAMIVSFLCGIKNRVCYYHTIEMNQTHSFSQFLLKWRKMLVYLLTTRIVAVSSSAASDLHSKYYYPFRKISVLYSLVHKQDNFNVARNYEQFVCIGSLIDRKGQIDIIKALPIVVRRYPNVSVVICGDGPNRKWLIEEARSLCVDSNIVFKGVVTPSEVNFYCAQSVCALLCSRAEAFGLAALEPLLYGTPVITTGVDGIKEIICNEVNGLFYSCGDSNQLADMMLKLLDNHDLWSSLSKGAFRVFNEKFSFENNLSSYIESYELLFNNN